MPRLHHDHGVRNVHRARRLVEHEHDRGDRRRPERRRGHLRRHRRRWWRWRRLLEGHQSNPVRLGHRQPAALLHRAPVRGMPEATPGSATARRTARRSLARLSSSAPRAGAVVVALVLRCRGAPAALLAAAAAARSSAVGPVLRRRDTHLAPVVAPQGRTAMAKTARSTPPVFIPGVAAVAARERRRDGWR